MNYPSGKSSGELFNVLATASAELEKFEKEHRTRTIPHQILSKNSGENPRARNLHRSDNYRAQPRPVGIPPSPIPEIEPWPHPVQGTDLLNRLKALLQEHLCLPCNASIPLTLWVVFTHAHDCFHTSPILAVLSPDKRCGKTTLLSCLRHLVARPLAMSNISSAAVYRAIDQWHPTLLIDEADTFLAPNEELRGILNSGHKREMATVIRSSGDNHDPRCFSTWSPKVIAKIGALSDTLSDRSISILLRRKKRDESVARLGLDEKNKFSQAGRMASRWARDHIKELGKYRHVRFEGLNDRAQDNWEPLFAIAQTVGNEWPALASGAALTASTASIQREEESIGALLLEDINRFFTETTLTRVASLHLATWLSCMEHRPWPEFRCYRPISPRQIAQILRPFDIFPKTVRISERETLKGYLSEDFDDAFSRYIDPKNVTS